MSVINQSYNNNRNGGTDMFLEENELGISPSIMDELITLESSEGADGWRADGWRLFQRLGYKLIVFNNGHIYDTSDLRLNKIRRCDVKQGYYMRVPYVGTAHRIVAFAYHIIDVYEYDHLHDVAHINGDRYDNRIENLQYITHAENIKKRDEMGGRCKAVEAYTVTNGVEEIVYQFDSIKKAARVTKLKESNICNCCKGKILTTGGLRWRYAY